MAGVQEFLRAHYAKIVILAVSLLSLSWFRGDNLIEFRDFYLPGDTARNFYRYFSLWDPLVPFGQPDYRNISGLIYPFLYFLTHNLLGFTLVQTEMVLFYLVFALSGLSMYYMMLVFGTKQIAALFSGLLYMFSPFDMLVMWGLITGRLVIFATLPLLLAVSKQVGRKQLTGAGIIGWSVLLTAISASADPESLLIASFPGVLYFIITRGWQRAGARRVLALVCTWVGLNMFWILPYAFFFQSAYQSVCYLTLIWSWDLQAFAGNSVSLIDAVRLTGFWELCASYRGDPYHSWSWAVVNPLYGSAGFLFPILAMAGVLAHRKNRDVLFFGGLAVVGIILMAGIQSPFGGIYAFILTKSGIIRLVRSPFTEFGTYVTVSYAVLIGLLLQKLVHRVN